MSQFLVFHRYLPCLGLLVLIGSTTFAAEEEPEKAPKYDPTVHYIKILEDKNIEATPAGLVRYLHDLHPTDEQRQKAAELIRLLGTPDSFKMREDATAALLIMPALPREQLIEASEGDDPEVRWRAKTVLKIGQTESKRVLFSAFRVIQGRKFRGTSKQLLAAIPLCDERHLISAARAALVAVASETDQELLREAAKSENKEIRRSAVAALGASLGKAAAADLNKALKDDEGAIRHEAARAMANYGDRGAVSALVDLLEQDDPKVRSAAAVTLRQFTGETQAFAAYDNAEKRGESIAKWRAWIKDDLAKAELVFPLKENAFGASYLAGNTLLGYGYRSQVVELDPSGKEVWNYGGVNGAWSAEKLANGNYLIACNSQSRVIEVTPDKKIVWTMSVSNALNAKQLENGNFLIARHGDGTAIEVTREKKIIWQYKPPRGQTSDIHRLPNGNTLIAAYGGPIVEVSPEKKIVWQYDGATQSYGCQPLPDGNVLIADFGGRVIEVSRDKKIVWQTTTTNPVDVFRLPNGNTLITGNTQFLEVTPEKKIIWTKTGCSYGSARR